MKRHIVVIAPILARYDAISAAAADHYHLLRDRDDWTVTLLTSHNALDLPARVVHGVAGLLADPAFRAADILLTHFGIYHPFVDALLVGNGHARQIVVFHNITPPDLVSASDRPIIETSLRQAHNLRHADEIWADSPTNAAALERFGIDPGRVFVVPLAVGRPPFGRLAEKPAGPLELLCVGRIVPAKGVRDLIEAVILARPAITVALRVVIAGNAGFSDAAYIDACKARIAEAGLQDCVELIETPDDATLEALYARAQLLCVPSFHEGFCVPVIEGLRAGCIPVGYASGNVPNVVNGLGRLVVSGDVAQLSDALVAIADDLLAARRDPSAACLRLDGGRISAAAFDRRARAHAQTFDFARLAAIKIGRVEGLLAGLGPSPYPEAGMTSAPQSRSSGRIVRGLSRLGQMPEPVKRHLRRGFVAALAVGRHMPGVSRAEPWMRRRLPGPHQWFAERYQAYIAPPEPPPLAPQESAGATDDAPVPLPDLGADERACFTRLAFAARSRARPVRW